MEPRENRVDWQSLAARLFCFALIFLGIYLVLSFAKTLVIVIAVVWGISAGIDSLARRTARVIPLPRKLFAVLYLIVLLLLIGLSLFFAARRLWEELLELALWVEAHQGEIGERVGAVMSSLEAFVGRIPLLGGRTETDFSGLGGAVDSMISELIHQVLSRVGASLSTSLGTMVREAPKALVTGIVTLLGCFYLSMDYEGLRDRLISFLPSKGARNADVFRQKAGKAVRRFLRAYFLLMLLTFSVVFVGLLILGTRYAFLIALLIAAVDILPILGVGTILVPWAVVMLLLKQYSVGLGLLILFGVATLVRQIAEPRLVGESLGIHPLVSLLFLFAGLELFGFFGMILGPAAALIFKELLATNEGKT